jgi:hypothetical protein
MRKAEAAVALAVRRAAARRAAVAAAAVKQVLLSPAT